LREMAEHAVNRVLVRVRADLQQLVVVDERPSAHTRLPTPPLSAGSRVDLNGVPGGPGTGASRRRWLPVPTRPGRHPHPGSGGVAVRLVGWDCGARTRHRPSTHGGHAMKQPQPKTGTRLTAEEIHDNVMIVADEELERPAVELTWSAIDAGLSIGFS